jgi:hypothetical protein
MMKKGVYLVLALTCAAVLVGCGGKKSESSGAGGGNAKAAASLLEVLGSGDQAAVEAALAAFDFSQLAAITGTSGSPGGDFSYDLNRAGDGIVIREYTGPGGVVVVPTTIEDIPVVEIGDEAFWDNKGIISAVLPPGIRKIGNSAFGRCINLTTAILPAGLEELEYGVFLMCPSLHTVNLPESIKSIGDEVFYYCGELYNLSIPDSLTAVQWGVGAFEDCGKLRLATRQRLKDLGYKGEF